MKKFNFKSLVPHLIAIAIFLIAAVFFCKPSLESGTVLKQGDIVGWQGMSHQSFEYKEKHGHFPLWTTNMFGGMPGYQIAMEINDTEKLHEQLRAAVQCYFQETDPPHAIHLHFLRNEVIAV